MPFEVGYTGTEKGMTQRQKFNLRILLLNLGPHAGRHGDCIGGDEEFDEICKSLDIPTWIHPPTNPKKRAFCKGNFTMPELPYLDRDNIIVITSKLLIAAPDSYQEQVRSGVWYTVRQARKLKRPIYILWP